MKKLIPLLALLALPAFAADVAIDLGENGILTVADTAVDGVNVIASMKSVVDLYRPPVTDPETGEVTPWTNAQYRAFLVEFLLERGKPEFGRLLQAEINRRWSVVNQPPQVNDIMTLTPP